MKNSLARILSGKKEFQDPLKIMKLPFFVVLLCMFNVYADGYSQTSTFSFSLNDVEIKQVFEEIENQSDYRFFYLTEQIDLERSVTISAEEETVESILDKVFQSSSLRYKILQDKRVVIMPMDFNQKQKSILISGKVIDKETRESMPGVNILIKGSLEGTISDLDGNYFIELPSENSILIFTFMGYAAQEIPYTGSKTINIELVVGLKSIDEVIVIGYGTSAKKDITGALTSIDEEIITDVPVTKIEQAIQGRVAGVQVVQGNSAPGSDPIIVIRGRNSINTGTAPLWIVDGFPYAGSVNPNDVASITVLKDASATAIYGSRGSNGVILVTTKKGLRNKQSLEFTMNSGISEIRKQVELLNAEEWVNVGVLEANKVEWNGPNTDWPGQIQRTGRRQEYNLSYEGGSENSRTYFSLNYKDVDGIIKNSYYESLQARMNSERNISKNFKVSNMMSATYSRNNRVNASFEALLFPPIYDILDENENYTFKSNVGLTNPVGAVTELIDTWKNITIYDYLSAELKLFEKVTAKVSLGGSIGNNHNQNFTPRSLVNLANGYGSAGQRYNSSVNWANENQLTYVSKISDDHNIKATGFFSQEFSRYEGFAASNQLLLTEILTYNNLNLNDTMQTVGSYVNQQTLMSLGARFDYNFKNKYYFTATFRRDGSSKFSEGNKWANFPALAVSWRINEENFMKDIDQITNMKLRLSYGKTGNQAIPINRSRLQYNLSGTRAVFNNVSQPAFVRTVLENPDLTWETTTQYNGGLDLSVLKDRLSLTVDYYYKLTSDLLFQKNLAGAAGGGVMYINKGKVRNKGLEIGLSANIINRNNFTWIMDGNYSHNRNMVVDLEDTKVISLGSQFGGWINSETHFLSEGYPMGVFYGYQVEGIFADQDDVDAHPEQTAIDAAPGEYKLKDMNNDGIVDIDDRTIIGNAEPDFIFGLNNNLKYKNFTLSFFIQGSVGNEIYNVYNVALLGGLKNYNRSTEYLNAWSLENTDTHIPKPGAISTQSLSAYVEDGSYIRLKDISISYTLPRKISEKLKIEDLSVSVSAQNYLTITNYKGYDPEVSWNSGNIWQGVDWGSYPTVKSITLGLKARL
jgi:TonB-dependent starch-binding outer membrane protein SusC